MTNNVVLTVSPHPDDEVLGIGATLAMLVANGWSMRNLACSLGHVEDHGRRRAELAAAGSRLGFETTVMNPLAEISRSDDLDRAVSAIAGAVAAQIVELEPAIVVSPHLTDGHHGHEVVAKGVRQALERAGENSVWWAYGIWNDLPRPNVFVPYDEPVMERVLNAIDAYGGENERSHHDQMYSARAVVNRTLGSERVFGFGSATASDHPYADLLTEMRFGSTGWEYARPRVLDAARPLTGTWMPGDMTWWVSRPTLREEWPE